MRRSALVVALALGASALAPTRLAAAALARRTTRLAAATDDCGCAVLSGDVPEAAKSMRHRDVAKGIELFRADGAATTLEGALTSRVNVVTFLRSFG